MNFVDAMSKYVLVPTLMTAASALWILHLSYLLRAEQWRPWMWHTTLVVTVVALICIASCLAGSSFFAALAGVFAGLAIYYAWTFSITVCNTAAVQATFEVSPEVFCIFAGFQSKMLWDERGCLWKDRIDVVRTCMDGKHEEGLRLLDELDKLDYPNPSFKKTNLLVRLLCARMIDSLEEVLATTALILEMDPTLFRQHISYAQARQHAEQGELPAALAIIESFPPPAKAARSPFQGWLQEGAGLTIEQGVLDMKSVVKLEGQYLLPFYAMLGATEQLHQAMKELRILETSPMGPYFNGLDQAGKGKIAEAEKSLSLSLLKFESAEGQAAPKWFTALMKTRIQRRLELIKSADYAKQCDELRPRFLAAFGRGRAWPP